MTSISSVFNLILQNQMLLSGSFCLNLQNYAELGPELTGTSRQVNETMKTVSDLARSLNLVVQPDSDFTFQISDTMREVSLMSKSLSVLPIY